MLTVYQSGLQTDPNTFASLRSLKYPTEFSWVFSQRVIKTAALQFNY